VRTAHPTLENILNLLALGLSLLILLCIPLTFNFPVAFNSWIFSKESRCCIGIKASSMWETMCELILKKLTLLLVPTVLDKNKYLSVSRLEE